MSELEHHQRLGPLVFDEIQKIITDSLYREAFLNFHVVHKVKSVIFALTGSLSPSLYPALCELTGVTWKVLRTPSTRKEIKYQIVKLKAEADINPAIVAYLKKVTTSYRPNDRAMVFCRTKDHARELAKLFQVQAYYAVQSEQDELNNVDIMANWRGGKNIVMVSTSILGCGLDYGHVRDVVHHGPAYTMMDQYQEDSRGGRDGLECQAVTFIVANQKYSVPQNKYDLGTKALYESMYEEVKCLRMAPTLYLDGVAVQCVSFPGVVFCQNCERLLESFPRREPDIFDSLPNHPSLHALESSSPRQELDLFDTPETLVDDQDHPTLRKRDHISIRSSTSSKTPNSSPKKRKLSHIPIPSAKYQAFPRFRPSSHFVSPILRRSSTVALPTLPRSSTADPTLHSSTVESTLPRSPTVETPTLRRPLQSSSIPVPVLRRRIIQPAGIQARQHQIVALERVTDYETNVMIPITKALDFFRSKCVMCCLYKKDEWLYHESDNCRNPNGTNFADPLYKGFRTSAITLPTGWCYGCLIPQVLCPLFFIFFYLYVY